MKMETDRTNYRAPGLSALACCSLRAAFRSATRAPLFGGKGTSWADPAIKGEVKEGTAKETLRKKKIKTATAILFFLALPFSSAWAEEDLQYYAESAAHYHKVDPLLLRAVWQAESAGKHTKADGSLTLSPVGAVGLGQLMPRTAWEMQVDPADKWGNAYGSAKYLGQMLERYGNNLELALAAYNAGPGRVVDRVPNIDETQRYVKTVLFYYDWFRAQVKPGRIAKRRGGSPAFVVWVDQY
jgi:soluble lytic murein transglycosylase-like protein